MVRNESAGIQLEPNTKRRSVRGSLRKLNYRPPQNIRILLISKRKVNPSWSASLSCTTCALRNATFCRLQSSSFPFCAYLYQKTCAPYL